MIRHAHALFKNAAHVPSTRCEECFAEHSIKARFLLLSYHRLVVARYCLLGYVWLLYDVVVKTSKYVTEVK
jgi:hypothetical protein